MCNLLFKLYVIILHQFFTIIYSGWKPSYYCQRSCQFLSEIWWCGFSADHCSVITPFHPVLFSHTEHGLAPVRLMFCPCVSSQSLPIISCVSSPRFTSILLSHHQTFLPLWFSSSSFTPPGSSPYFHQVSMFPPCHSHLSCSLHSSLPLFSFLCRTMTLESSPPATFKGWNCPRAASECCMGHWTGACAAAQKGFLVHDEHCKWCKTGHAHIVKNI